MSSFHDLGLDGRILQALTEEGYTAPTPIQAQSIPAALEGRHLLGIAQTGTCKTAAIPWKKNGWPPWLAHCPRAWCRP